MLEITQDFYHVERQAVTINQITAVKNIISQSPLLLAYVGVAILEAWRRVPSEDTFRTSSSEAKNILVAVMSFKPRILIQRALHRAESCLLVFYSSKLFCLSWAFANHLYLNSPSNKTTSTLDRSSCLMYKIEGCNW
jgi:hypothetical protein